MLYQAEIFWGMVDSREVYWYILHMGYIISAIIGLGVGIVAGLCLKGSHGYAARSLRKQLRISECLDSLTDNSTVYHMVQITIGKGNWYCRLLRLLNISVRLAVYGSIRWIPSDNPSSIGFHAHIYPLIGKRVIKSIPSFYIIPNTKVELAALKSELGNIYALGGFFPDIQLMEDYNLTIELFNQDTNESLPKLSLNNYMQKVGLIS